MAAQKPLFVQGPTGGVTSPPAARMALAGLLSPKGAGPLGDGAGILYGPGTPLAVTGSSTGSTMKYNIAAGVVVTQRGTDADGMSVWANDAPVLNQDSGAVAPVSGSRYDLIWCRHKDNPTFGDSDSNTEFGVLVGVATGGTPTKPYGAGQGAGGTSLPAGYLVIAESLVTAGLANAAGATITMVAPYKVARGAPITVRSSAERDALTKFPGLQVLRLDVAKVPTETWDGTAWRGRRTAYTPTWTAVNTAPTLADGTLTGWYEIVGDMCFVGIDLLFGTSTGGGAGAYTFSLPFAAAVEAALAGKVTTSNGQTWTAIGSIASGGSSVIPWAAAAASVSNSVPVASAGSAGTVGTGNPTIAGAYSFGPGARVTLTGSYPIA